MWRALFQDTIFFLAIYNVFLYTMPRILADLPIFIIRSSFFKKKKKKSLSYIRLGHTIRFWRGSPGFELWVPQSLKNAKTIHFEKEKMAICGIAFRHST